MLIYVSKVAYQLCVSTTVHVFPWTQAATLAIGSKKNYQFGSFFTSLGHHFDTAIRTEEI